MVCRTDHPTRRRTQPRLTDSARVRAPSVTDVEVLCSCGRWTLHAAFCSHCGRELRQASVERVG